MNVRALSFVLLGTLLLGGCMQSTVELASDANLKPRDREYLARAQYARAYISENYRRHVVDYHRKESPGTIVVDQDSRYLYYVMAGNKAIRYGVTVGEEAQNWSGVATIGNKTEWPTWTPTPGEHRRFANLPKVMPGGPDNPMGSRALYLHTGGKDTLFRIHGTNQPEYIGQAISSGCIRMLNEDVIDLYNRAKVGGTVVVLAPGHGDSPSNPRVAYSGAGQN